MSRHFQRPENALKRAKELCAVGKSDAAVKLLHQILMVRRHRTWTKTHEPIMKQFLSICVEKRDSMMTKDGLHQYRNISQHQAPASL